MLKMNLRCLRQAAVRIKSLPVPFAMSLVANGIDEGFVHSPLNMESFLNADITADRIRFFWQTESIYPVLIKNEHFLSSVFGNLQYSEMISHLELFLFFEKHSRYWCQFQFSLALIIYRRTTHLYRIRRSNYFPSLCFSMMSGLRTRSPFLLRSCRNDEVISEIRRFCASSSSPNNTTSIPKSVPHEPDQSTTKQKSKRVFSPLLADPVKKKIIDKMLRVDHAGEIGARQIYAGQLAVFRGTPVGSVISEMADQEKKHLDAFDRLVVERRVRPTAMLPIWNVAGYALGLGTALIGKEAAMACTVAVEDVIAEHYNDQVRTLLDWEEEEELRALFREFRDDELEHKDTGIEHDAEQAPLYKAMSNVIKAGCRVAIAITERV